MFGIAKALLASGFTPNNTIVICAMAAEEWGVVDSNFDWSTGAYEQVFTAHPEWVGKVIADLNSSFRPWRTVPAHASAAATNIHGFWRNTYLSFRI